MKAITYRSRLFASVDGVKVFGVAFCPRGKAIGSTDYYNGTSSKVKARLGCNKLINAHAKAQGIVRAIHEME